MQGVGKLFLGDLHAVEKGLGLKNIAKLQAKAKFRNSDSIANAAQEIKMLGGTGTYSKIEGAQVISPHLDLSGGNKSQSFNTLILGIKKLVESCV